jgi:hypothetical protein
MKIKELFCIHDYEYLGVARDGKYDQIADSVYNLFICKKCLKLKKKNGLSVLDCKQKNIRILAIVLDEFYNRKQVKIDDGCSN